MPPKHCALHRGQPLRDLEGRYDMAISAAEPLAARPDLTQLQAICVCDSRWPPPPWEPEGTWARVADQQNWWLRDEDGVIVPGWGDGRYCINPAADDGAPLRFWQRTCHRLIASRPWLDGFHWDDLNSARNVLAAIKGAERLYNAWRYTELVTQFSYWLRHQNWLNSVNGFFFWKDEDAGQWADIVEVETFRHQPRFPYRGPGEQHTIEDWITGKPGWSPGILNLTPQRGILLDCFFSEAWSFKKFAAYATLCVATACLRNDIWLSLHPEPPHQAHNPRWCRILFERADRLGEPLSDASEVFPRVWMRRFAGGFALVNANPRTVRVDYPDAGTGTPLMAEPVGELSDELCVTPILVPSSSGRIFLHGDKA